MRAHTVSRWLAAGVVVLGFGMVSGGVAASDRTIIAPWMTIGEDPYAYDGFWGPRPLGYTRPYSVGPAFAPPGRVRGPATPFPGRGTPVAAPPFVNGCPPGFGEGWSPPGRPGFAPPPFAPCPVSR